MNKEKRVEEEIVRVASEGNIGQKIRVLILTKNQLLFTINSIEIVSPKTKYQWILRVELKDDTKIKGWSVVLVKGS